jgi:hypothetical protein
MELGATTYGVGYMSQPNNSGRGSAAKAERTTKRIAKAEAKRAARLARKKGQLHAIIVEGDPD